MHSSQTNTVKSAALALLCHPVENLLLRWNWKSALTSSVTRAFLFFFTNVTAGPAAALRAMLTELLLRTVTAGFYGAITQGFRAANPRWAAMGVVLVAVPILTHSLELFVHWLRGTPHLTASIAVSATFTGISTAFNLFAMREGILIVGEGEKSLGEDLKALPRLIFEFLRAMVAVPFNRLKEAFEA